MGPHTIDYFNSSLLLLVHQTDACRGLDGLIPHSGNICLLEWQLLNQCNLTKTSHWDLARNNFILMDLIPFISPQWSKFYCGKTIFYLKSLCPFSILCFFNMSYLYQADALVPAGESRCGKMSLVTIVHLPRLDNCHWLFFFSILASSYGMTMADFISL